MLNRRTRRIFTVAMTVLGAVAATLACIGQSATSLTQVVKPADPGVVWAAPAAIPFGTALDDSNLNATARVAGSFLYDPPAGAILPPGPHTLSVRFQPANPNFLVGTASVSLQVLPPGDSSFDLAFTGTGAAFKPMLLSPGHPAVVNLVVKPIRDFHQPVSFSCGRTEPQLVCVFSPQTARPLTAPVDVTLTVSIERGPGGVRVRAFSRTAGALLYIPLSLLGTLSLLKRRMLYAVRLRLKSVLGVQLWGFLALSLALVATLSGCGGGGWTPTRNRVLPVTASSLVESHTLDLSFVIVPQ